jgi:hypothetical protein
MTAVPHCGQLLGPAATGAGAGAVGVRAGMGAGTGMAAAVAWPWAGTGTNTAPHWSQKRADEGFSTPHWGQNGTARSPFLYRYGLAT